MITSSKIFQTLFFVYLIGCFGYVLYAVPGYAQGSMEGLLEGTAESAGFAVATSEQGTAPAKVVGKIVAYTTSFIGILFTCYTVYGGFLWLTAGGNSDKVDKAKKIIRDGVIGIVLIYSALGIYLVIGVISDVLIK